MITWLTVRRDGDGESRDRLPTLHREAEDDKTAKSAPARVVTSSPLRVGGSRSIAYRLHRFRERENQGEGSSLHDQMFAMPLTRHDKAGASFAL